MIGADMTAETAEIFPFDNSYARLPDRFFARLPPTPVAQPRLIKLNEILAVQLGLDPARLATPEGVATLAGNVVPAAGEPLAMAYAGHQFGGFVPQLGDGRAILLGEVIDRDGVRRDIQLKGAGPTPFSRRGDGRAALGPVLREYIVSEAMAALGIPSTRALAAVATGETVWRETALPGAVFARVASSHIRIGTFQFFAARGDLEGIRILVDHVAARHYPEARSWLLLEDGEPVGRSIETPGTDHLLLIDLMVAPSARRRGLATWMIEALAQKARADGLPLRCHVDPNNDARQMYTRLGFTVIGHEGGSLVLELT